MTHTISIKRQVEFYETDMAGIVHFSNYFRWMEAAEAAFFRTLQIPITKREEVIISGWPKVNATCCFKAPLHFNDEVEIVLAVREIKNHSLCYTFQFYKIQCDKRTEVATGEMTTVYTKFNILENSMSASLIEAEFREEIHKALGSSK